MNPLDVYPHANNFSISTGIEQKRMYICD